MLPKNAVAKLGEEKDKRKHIVQTSHKRLTLGTNYNKENCIIEMDVCRQEQWVWGRQDMHYHNDAGDRSTLKTIRNGHAHPWKNYKNYR